MIKTELRTEDLPVADRLAAWHELTCRSVAGTKIRADCITDFPATARMLDFGSVQVSLETFPALQVERSAKRIRRSDPEQIHLAIYLSGNSWFNQADREAVITARDLLLYDTWHPFYGRATPTRGNACTAMRIQIARGLVPLPSNAIDQLIARRLSGSDGLGNLVRRCLQELLRNTARYRTTDTPSLATLTVDLLVTFLAHELNTETALPPETRRQTLLACIHDFITGNLPDPTLSPATVAAAHHISTRHLHRLFQHQGLTVAGVIRQYRLERCHYDLANPHLRHLNIHTIASRWGFTDNAHFSRLFRTTYGIGPRDYRHVTEHSTRWARTDNHQAPQSNNPLTHLFHTPHTTTNHQPRR